MKKPILAGLLMIILAVILLPQEIEIEAAADPIVIRESGMVHWLWLIAVWIVTVFFTVLMLGLCQASGRADLEGKIMHLELELKKEKEKTKTTVKTIKGILKKK